MANRDLVDIAKVAAELVDARTGFMGRGEIERVVRLVMQQEEGEALRSRAGELKQLIAARYAHSNSNLDTFLAGLIKQSSNITHDDAHQLPCIYQIPVDLVYFCEYAIHYVRNLTCFTSYKLSSGLCTSRKSFTSSTHLLLTSSKFSMQLLYSRV